MSEKKSTRRQFHKQAALLAAAPLVAGATAEAAQPQPATSAAAALAELARVRFGKHLTEEQLKRVRQRVQQQQGMAALLRKTPLSNGDEPDFVFSAEVP